MKEVFQEANNLIKDCYNVLLTMHERMDGDDGGALLAMAFQLEKMGKQVTCAIKKKVPANLLFLPGSNKIQDDIETSDFDLLITFGCSSVERTGSEKIKKLSNKQKLKILNIDHHPDNKNFGNVNMVDPAKSSVAELVYDFFIFNNWDISKDIATCILTGIITDTGGYMHANTQSSTLKTSAELLKKGARTYKITKQTFSSKNPETLRAWGKALENIVYDEKNKIIYSIMSETDLKSFQNLPTSAFEGFAETLNTFPEAKFGMFIKQDGNIIKGSLRSDIFKNEDVSKIAKNMGGGGHKLASGFSVAGKLIKEENGKWKIV